MPTRPEIDVRTASKERLRRKPDDVGGGVTSVKADMVEMSATAKEKLQDAKGLGSKGGSGEGMPKPEAGEDMLSPTYKERLRKWRERSRAGVTMDHAGAALARRMEK